MQQDRHQGIIFTDDSHQVDAGVKFLCLRVIALVEDHSDIGNYTQKIPPVLLKISDSLLKAGRKEYLRPRPLTVFLLVIVQGFRQELTALREHNLV